MPAAYIAMGANLPSSAGPPEVTLAAAAGKMAALGRLAARSSLYSTKPVGHPHQPRFVNAVVALDTELSARALLDALLELEREFGRDRSNAIVNGPRTLDLDILLFGDFVIDEPRLHVPHPRLAQRAFVLVPLNEIAPHALEPRTGSKVADLLRALTPSSADDAVLKIDSDTWRAGAERPNAGK